MTTIRLISPILTLGFAALLLAPGCSKSEAKTDPAKASASAAQKPAAAAKAGEKKGEKKKNGGQHNAKAAQDAKQKISNVVKEKKSEAEKKEEKIDGLDCNADLEGVAWCSSESDLLFCYDNEWWELDCTKLASGSFCGFDLENLEVNCMAGADLE